MGLSLLLRTLLRGVGGAFPRAPAPRPPAVLFVCRHGSVKSPIARELLRRSASARGVAVTATSRGLTPEQRLTPTVAAALGVGGIEVAGEPVVRLASSDIAEADLIVTFDWPADRDAPGSARDWSGVPSFGEDYDRALAELSRRIEALLDSISAGGRSR